jgi:hypothetical protein
MKKNFLIIACLIISFIASAQQKPKVELSKPYPVVDAKSKEYLKFGDDIVTVKDNIIQVFGANDMKLKSTNEFTLPKNAVIENIQVLKDKLVMFYSLWDKENKTEQLFCTYIKNGKLDGDGKILFKVSGKVTGDLSASGFYSFEVVNKFKFQYSSLGDNLLIYYRVKPEIKSDDVNFDVIGMNVYDSNLSGLWAKEVKMPYTEKKMDNIDYSVDNEGNVYILTRIYNDETTRLEVDDKPNFRLEIIKAEANSGIVTKTPIALDEKFVRDLSLFECTDEYMICTGFTRKSLKSGSDGIVVFKILKGGGLSEKKYYFIPLEIVNQYETERTQARNKKKTDEDAADFLNLRMESLVVQKDGSIIMIGEQKYIQVVRTKNGYTYIYWFCDMLFTKINADGSLAYMKKLPKKQKGNNQYEQLSYKYMPGNGCHYVLFMDNNKNVNLDLNSSPAVHVNGFGGFLTAYKVNDSDGQTERISILDIKDVKGMELYQFAMGRILPINTNTFIFEAYKKQKEDVMVRVTF